ncbi:hypothetical protein OC834_001147 [Tilletia horrida]|nr:hypothetical protein OC834_001147 [Tilletia horrida]
MNIFCVIWLLSLSLITVSSAIPVRSIDIFKPGALAYGDSPHHRRGELVERKLTPVQMRLLAGGMWLAAETSGFTLNFLKFKKNYGRRDGVPRNRSDLVQRREWVPNAGKAMFGLATLFGLVGVPIAYSNAALLPAPEHPATRSIAGKVAATTTATSGIGNHDSERGLVVVPRSAIDSAAAGLGAFSVGVSLVAIPLNVAMYEKMKAQHLGIPFPTFHGF